MYGLSGRNGLLLTGLAVALIVGCGDDKDKKVRYRHERPEARRTDVDVDVHVGRSQPEAVVEPEPVVVEREGPPVVVERREPDVVVVDRPRHVVVVREAPPAVIVERRPQPPRGSCIWIEGYWHHDGHRYVWAKGRYEKERRGHHYIQPRWVHGDRGWEFHEGHWD